MKSWLHSVAWLAILIVVACGCSDSQIHRTVKAVGPDKLRTEAIAACGNKFPKADAIKIPETNWAPSMRAFHPLSVWAEPDGVYLLMDSDAEGERGVFVPRILSEKDPVCGPTVKHVKVAQGVYWYERKRA